jgi:hypothetical protein
MERQVKKKTKWYQRALKSLICRSSSFLVYFSPLSIWMPFSSWLFCLVCKCCLLEVVP